MSPRLPSPLTRPLSHAALVAALLLAWASPGAAQLRAQLVVSGLASPVGFVQHPGVPNAQLIVEQGGRIRVLQNGALLAQDFLNLTTVISKGGERGLLGLAFDPNYATTRRFFVNFTNTSGHTVVARFLVDAANPLRAVASSRFDLVWPTNEAFIRQPAENHNGGDLAFGSDGFLYIGLGDGGSADDPLHRAQNPGTLLGKMLRIDVSVASTNARGYRIPSTNPFVGDEGDEDVLDEIWAFGLRNPWRFSFDAPARGGTGALIIGDVGQGQREEINYEPARAGGRNYGWRNREGKLAYLDDPEPFSTPLTDPLFDYDRGVGRAVIGGFVYRGSALGSSYRGRYFFADYATSQVRSLGLSILSSGEARVVDQMNHTAELNITRPSSFGVDAAGELYIVSHAGSIYRIARSTAGGGTGNGPFPLTITPPTGGRISTAGINCGAGGTTCSTAYPAGFNVVLNHSASAGYVFGGWTGDCAPGGTTQMTQARTCGATFNAVGTSHALTVSPKPTGGTVTGTGINCGVNGSDCTESFPNGMTVTLQAAPAAGFAFSGWTGACNTSGQVTMSTARTCGATFSPTGGGGTGPFTLTVLIPVVSGGGGVIFGSGIRCDKGSVGFCTRTAPAGSVIAMTAYPDPGFVFAGWTGAGCSSAITLTSTLTCTANFRRP